MGYTSGYTSLDKAQSSIAYPISYTQSDIEWFLYCGMETFLQLQQKVM